MYIGKTIIIGVTHFDHNGNAVQQDEYHGTIESVSDVDGVSVRCIGFDKNFTMPPITTHFQQALPGEFIEVNSGAKIIDPDLMCAWEVTWYEDKSKNPRWKAVNTKMTPKEE